ncbi:MAG: trypsin-like serine protease [Phycisphaeraceae bacterium]|nr:trypsin-like serine protease [Phycisphaerales bacterium]MCB9859889.1 trypsin-like serine protease [Phycisphaeraceae bacterium]
MRNKRVGSSHIAALCVAAGAIAGFGLTQSASAQAAPVLSEPVQIGSDSGFLANNGEPGFNVVYSTVVSKPGASWMRLYFGDVVLSGNKYDVNRASYIRITSMFDGDVQTLNARELEDWHNSTAYLNGDTVIVELLAAPDTGLNRLIIDSADAGLPVAASPESLCGADDRQLSTDPRNARLMPIGCTVWLINDAEHCFLTAGHCISNGTTNAVAQFNVPLSSSGGGTINPPSIHQYPVNSASIQSNGGQGIGNDYAYVGFNQSSGMTPFERQGDAYSITTALPPNGTTIRITGYGTTSSPVSPTWNQVQKTHTGPRVASVQGSPNPVSYQVDTTGGNSGSPVINDVTGMAIGIHTHAGCSSTAGNNGTQLAHAGMQNFLNNPKGICIPAGLTFVYPSGLPGNFEIHGGDTIEVVVQANGSNIPQPGTGEFHYDDGSGVVTVAMTQTSSNTYSVTLPTSSCGTVRDFFFSAETTSGQTYTDPKTAPTQTYSTTATTYADCSQNNTLDIFDYICFGGLYAANDPYADCDGNSVLNIFDYICFGTAYGLGCN